MGCVMNHRIQYVPVEESREKEVHVGSHKEIEHTEQYGKDDGARKGRHDQALSVAGKFMVYAVHGIREFAYDFRIGYVFLQVEKIAVEKVFSYGPAEETDEVNECAM